MRAKRPLILIVSTFLLTLSLAACEQEAESQPEPAEVTADQAAQPAEAPDEAEDKAEAAAKPGPAPSPPRREPEPLVEALEAPEDAVTSSGRFEELMSRGLDVHMPEIGLMYGAAGIDQPGVRIAIAADGRGRWARGDGPYYGELERDGDFELTDEEAAELAELISGAWTSDAEYPSSSVKQTRLLILRDGEAARVFEHSALPSGLEKVEAILRRHLPEQKPQ